MLELEGNAEWSFSTRLRVREQMRVRVMET